MVSKTKDYKLPHLYPWVVEKMEYDGCCNHDPFEEAIPGAGDENLAPEQIEAV
jgi:hypothetical protein